MISRLDGLVTWAEIDLDAIAHNVRALAHFIGPTVEIMGVVKGNAYGHGAVPVARAMLEAGATRLMVARVPEGVELRRAGIFAPILIAGYTPPASVEAVVRWRLTPAVITGEVAEALASRAAVMGATVPVHVKVDSGMNRYGLAPREVLDFVRMLRGLPGLRVEGVFTHFATADATDDAALRRQLAVFGEVLGALDAAGLRPPLTHAANSAAAIHLPTSRFDMVRPGIALYGLDPSDEWRTPLDLRPALALKSRVSRVHEVPPGEGVSYGFTFVADAPTRAALVAAGYGDGYHRNLSNLSSVLIRGQRARLLGRVSMDQLVVDITGIDGVQQDDEVVLIGRQSVPGAPEQVAEIRAEELAALSGTINYEITTALQARITRLYLRGGQVVQVAAVGEL
jgi:alanine racemase